MNYTALVAIERGTPNEQGWRKLVRRADAGHLGENFPTESAPLLVLHHLSDLHVCDTRELLTAKRLEGDHGIEPVQELGPELLAHCSEHLLASHLE